jgi:nucleotide-binding universal stress UspA family protein
MDDAKAKELAIFKKILCGVDGTPASLIALRQATRLQDEGGDLKLTVAVNVAKAAHAGMAATHAADLMQTDAEAALAEAEAIAPSATAHVVNGDPVSVLLQEAEEATLVAVGSHGRGRAVGMLLGTVAARMLRDAPSSVLIAKEARAAATWPRSVVVGVDGSVDSADAFAVARQVAGRFDASLHAIASIKDQLDQEAAEEIAPELEVVPGGAVEILTAASESVDLIVVGSRGLHGLKALGSVSERVAYQASTSVLVVRPG